MAVSRRGLLARRARARRRHDRWSAAPSSPPRRPARPAPSVLVVVSLRGGADGLSLVVPHGDPGYYAARPRIAIRRTELLVADAFFGLHPALAALLPAVERRQGRSGPRDRAAGAEPLALLGYGGAGGRRPGVEQARVGWLNRLVGAAPGSSPLQGFSAGTSTIPTSLVGPGAADVAGRVDDVELAGRATVDDAGTESLQTMWDGEKTTLGRSMRATFEAIHSFGPAQAAADNRATYPGSGLGRRWPRPPRSSAGTSGSR